MNWKPPIMTKEQLIDRDVASFIRHLKKEYGVNKIQPQINITKGKIKVHGGCIGVGISSDGSINLDFLDDEI